MKQNEHLPDEKGPDQLLVSRPTLKSSPKFEIKQDKALSSMNFSSFMIYMLTTHYKVSSKSTGRMLKATATSQELSILIVRLLPLKSSLGSFVFTAIEQARKESVGSLVSLQRKQTARREDPPEAARLAKLMSMDSEMSNEEKSLSLGSRQLKLRNRHGSSASDEITGFQVSNGQCTLSSSLPSSSCRTLKATLKMQWTCSIRATMSL